MTRAQKIAIVAGIQIVVLLSILGFGQWTVWTADTIALKLEAPTNPPDLRNAYAVRYAISSVDRSGVTVDAGASGDVYVELVRSPDGSWEAIAVHADRHHTRDGTVLLEGFLSPYGPKAETSSYFLSLGKLEGVHVSAATAARLPSGSGRDIRVEVRVNRFGHGTPLHFVVDGRRYPLEGP